MVYQEEGMNDLSIHQLNYIISKANFLIAFKTTFPTHKYLANKKISIDDILELSDPEVSSCTEVEIYYVNLATKYIANKCIFYFSLTFSSLHTLSLVDCRNIQNIIKELFDQSTSKFPSLSKISITRSDINRDMVDSIVKHFSEYLNLIRPQLVDEKVYLDIEGMVGDEIVTPDKKIYLSQKYEIVSTPLTIRLI
jgi:hypothetical protein